MKNFLALLLFLAGASSSLIQADADYDYAAEEMEEMGETDEVEEE